MRSVLVIWIFVAGWIPQVFAGLEDARFRGRTDEFVYDVRMRFKPAPATPHYPDAPKHWTVFDTLKVTLNGREITAPQAALKGLFWPHPEGAPYAGPGGTLR